MKYKFNPIQYGFLSPKCIPAQLKDYLGENSFVKIINASANGSFWYVSCSPMILRDDERWIFFSGAYDAWLNRNLSSQIYCGCVTSAEYAEVLLVHLFGTTTNEGTLKYGKERLNEASLSI